MLKIPKFQISYNSVDITDDISQMIQSLSYSDSVSGKMDELELEVDDTDFLWTNGWYPDQAASLNVKLGYEDITFDAGLFSIDEIESSGPPDMVRIRAVSAPVDSSLRTKRVVRYERQSLESIVNRIASRNGLEVFGDFRSTTIERETQSRETDLSMLYRLSKKYGYVFNIKDSRIVFVSIYELEERDSVITIDRSELTNFSIVDKLSQIYTSARVRYSNPVTGDTSDQSEDNQTQIAGQDVYNSWTRTSDNESQARETARAAIYDSQTTKITGHISIEGNTAMFAGNNFEIIGMGRLSGIYHILGSTHTIDSGGYFTRCTIKRLRDGSGATSQMPRI